MLQPAHQVNSQFLKEQVQIPIISVKPALEAQLFWIQMDQLVLQLAQMDKQPQLKAQVQTLLSNV